MPVRAGCALSSAPFLPLEKNKFPVGDRVRSLQVLRRGRGAAVEAHCWERQDSGDSVICRARESRSGPAGHFGKLLCYECKCFFSMRVRSVHVCRNMWPLFSLYPCSSLARQHASS